MTRVYVDLAGDLFHAGHVALLQEARRHGDHLVAGVLSDETVASYKRRPVMTLAERVTVVWSAICAAATLAAFMACCSSCWAVTSAAVLSAGTPDCRAMPRILSAASRARRL